MERPATTKDFINTSLTKEIPLSVGISLLINTTLTNKDIKERAIDTIIEASGGYPSLNNKKENEDSN